MVDIQIIQDFVNTAREHKTELTKIADAIDFTPEDWQFMFKEHRDLAWRLSEVLDRHGSGEKAR